MSLIKLCSCLCALFCLFGCDSRRHRDGISKLNNVLTVTQLLEAQERAMKGDARSAGELASIYPNELSLYWAGAFWNEIAAENGGVDAQFSYGYHLMGLNSTFGDLRSIYWLDCSLRGGNNSSIDPLKNQIQKIRDNNKNTDWDKVMVLKKSDKWSEIRNMIGVELSVVIGDPDAYLVIMKTMKPVEIDRVWPFPPINNAVLDDHVAGGQWMVLCAQNGDNAAIKALLEHFNISDRMAACRMEFWEKKLKSNVDHSNGGKPNSRQGNLVR